MLEIVPSSAKSTYRTGGGRTEVRFSTADLFGPGDSFALTKANKAFANAPLMNNGGTLDYSVTVLAYDEVAHEAFFTIKNISAAQ